MKNKKDMKKIKAGAAVTALVLTILAIAGPAMIVDALPDAPEGNDIYMGDVTVTLTAVDNQSGVNYTMYKVDREDNNIMYPGEWIKVDADPLQFPYNVQFVCSEFGNYTISYYSVDHTKNTETIKVKTFTIVPIDVTPPETTIEIEGNQL